MKKSLPVIIYFLVLFVLIIITHLFNIAMLRGVGIIWSLPTPWGIFMMSFYYIAPFIFAFFGSRKSTYRTKSFFKILLTIFSIFLLFSIFSIIIRQFYLSSSYPDIDLKIESTSHEIINDELKIKGQVIISNAPKGEYTLAVFMDGYQKISDSSKRLYPRIGISYDNIYQIQNEGKFTGEYEATAYLDLLERGIYSIDLELNDYSMERAEGTMGAIVNNINRWSPFFKKVGFNGYDATGVSETIVASIDNIYEFSIQ